MNIFFECPNCEKVVEIEHPKYYEMDIISNGASFQCSNCKKFIVIELYTTQDEEDMESE
jgi:hypothetical protein